MLEREAGGGSGGGGSWFVSCGSFGFQVLYDYEGSGGEGGCSGRTL